MHAGGLSDEDPILKKQKGCADSGANVSLTNYMVAESLNLQLHLWEYPVKIQFANSSVELCKYYVDGGPLLGRIAVLKSAPGTLLSIWNIISTGFQVLFGYNQLQIVHKRSGVM